MESTGRRGDQRVLMQLPLAITPDLKRIVLPGCAVTIPDHPTPKAPEAARLEDIQTLDFSLTPGSQGNMPFKFPLDQFNDTYALFFSDSGEFVMTIHQSNGMVDISGIWGCKLWLATIYYSPKEVSNRPNYRYLSSLAFHPCECLSSVEDRVLLHPYLPLVAFNQHGTAFQRTPDGDQPLDIFRGRALWKFSPTGKSPSSIVLSMGGGT